MGHRVSRSHCLASLLSFPSCRSTLKLWVPLLATVVAVKAGEHVSGPSLNSGAWPLPALAAAVSSPCLKPCRPAWPCLACQGALSCKLTGALLLDGLSHS